MSIIRLSNGLACVVSEQDFDFLSKTPWNCLVKNMQQRQIMYATTMGENRKCVYMHRVITGAVDLHVDHIDGNGLNNRRENLRLVTRSKNAQRRYARCSQSGFLGVFPARHNKWVAQIGLGGKKFYLGTFDDKIDAAKAYDEMARTLYGELAMFNFPKQ